MAHKSIPIVTIGGMAGDQRDWYRDWWRKRTGYVERARFRMSEGDLAREKHRFAWRRNFFVLAVLVAVFAVVVKVLKT